MTVPMPTAMPTVAVTSTSPMTPAAMSAAMTSTAATLFPSRDHSALGFDKLRVQASVQHGDCRPRRWAKHWQRDSTRNQDPEKEVSPRGCRFLDLLSFKHRRLLEHAHHPGKGSAFYLLNSQPDQAFLPMPLMAIQGPPLGDGFSSATFRLGIGGFLYNPSH